MINSKVCISILNWNNADETLRCIESLSSVRGDNVTIVVLDNGSTDQSVKKISTVKNIELIQSQINLGFAGGHNYVISHVSKRGFDYFWLLNNDAIVQPGCLENLLASIGASPSVGMVSPVIRDIDFPHAYQQVLTLLNATGTGVEEHADLDQAKELQVKYPSRVILWGTGLLIKRSTIDKVGLLDEKLFAYSEDTDFSLRCMRSGLFNNVVFDATLLHHQPVGLRKSHYYYYTHRNAFLTWKKYVGIVDLLRLTRWNLKLAKRQIVTFDQQTELIDSLKLGIWHGWVGRGGGFDRGERLGYFPRFLVNSFLAIA